MREREAGRPVRYPDCDRKPLTDNTSHYWLLVYLSSNLDRLFAAREDVFVAANLLWYAVEGNPRRRIGLDVLVALGRPKGYRGSYRQWEEGGVAPQVVFEVTSPGNSESELERKRRFCGRYGVREFYLYRPDRNELEVWLRRGGRLRRRRRTEGFVSPALGVRFDLSSGALRVFFLDGTAFRTHLELVAEAEAASAAALVERQSRRRAEQERDAERARAEAEAARAEAEAARAEAEAARAEAEAARAEALAALLRQHGIEPPT